MRGFWNGVGVIAGGAIGVAAAMVLLSVLGVDQWSAWRDDGGEIEKLKAKIEQLEAASK